MKIIIFGASGSGTTTLGKSLAEKLGWNHLDADDYYWKKTNPPFQEKETFEERNQKLLKDFLKSENVIISGSLVTWNSYWQTAFDLAIFLKIPQEIRLERLRKREEKMYGEKWKQDVQAQEKFNKFLEWAAKYDDENFDGRSITQHKNWLKTLNCITLEIDGDFTNKERIEKVIARMER
ncbi:AAA family ATPase [Aureivirga marina]|uniref:AAA family ATPase n=1 Tax=Aureivirga marina TaxID=1182451 RepID=UPI0018CB509E|nr:AAA family ATPase [Aureivirga marina]